MDDLYRGQRIGKYEILTQLTLGGMAELFLAFTSGPGGFRKYVVVKRILPDAKGDEQFVKMFLDEARITAAFSHPNIAQVFDLDEDPEGLYLAMEFISGQNLNQVAAACNRRQQPIPIGFTCTVARDTCNALHYAHTFTDPTGRSFPVIHRDVAQKNVMVTYEGVSKLLDFGIAKAKGKLGRTNVGMVKGTTGYMSPEQVRGEEIDGRSDVFSVGVMVHEMLTGQRLFGAETELQEMELILSGPIPRIEQLNPLVPEAVAELVHRALARERADRWPNARELAKAIERNAAQVLFDPEQMGALMRELFEEKMAATRALLESAGINDSMLAKAAVKKLRGDEGADFEEAHPREKPKPRHSKSAAPPGASGSRRAKVAAPSPAPDHDTDEKVALVDTRPATAAASAGEPTAPAAAAAKTAERPARESRWGGVFAIVLAAAIVGGGYGVYHFVFSLPPATEDLVADRDREIKPFVDPRLRDFPAPGIPGAPVPGDSLAAAGPTGASGPSGASGPGDPSARADPSAGAQGDKAEPKKQKSSPGSGGKKGPEGTLTLITRPESQVQVGKKVVGTTPLFNVTLPAGTHLLKLKGPDGRTYTLSAPIKAGENTKFRVSLADLPAL